MTKVINFCAGPSAGKTTAALGVAHKLKTLRKNVLYVPEFPLEMVVANRLSELDDQLYILGEQAHRLYMAKDQFEYIVTDAPLFMQVYYCSKGNQKFKSPFWHDRLNKLIMATFDMYDNVTYFVDRTDRQFLQAGRTQNEEESKVIDKEILDLLNSHSIDYRRIVDADDAWENLDVRGIFENNTQIL